MSILSRLFGSKGSAAPEAASEEYKGFQITPNPTKEGSAYRVGAKITRDVDGTPREHQLIRADTIEGYEAACTASVGKAKQMIDEQGDGLFGSWSA